MQPLSKLYAHMVLIFVENCGGGTLAFADYCLLDELTKKPLAGFINICDEVTIKLFYNTLFPYCLILLA